MMEIPKPVTFNKLLYSGIVGFFVILMTRTTSFINFFSLFCGTSCSSIFIKQEACFIKFTVFWVRMQMNYRTFGYYGTQVLRVGGILSAMGIAYLGFHGEEGIDGLPVALGYSCAGILALMTNSQKLKQEWRQQSLDNILEKD